MSLVSIRICVAFALLCCATTTRAADNDLYRAQTIVTGTGEANRLVGFADCLVDVLVKVSGVQNIADNARAAKLTTFKSNAKDLVGAFSYHDQMSGIPIHDEQGTRDRPYDLTVDFDPDKISGVLDALGLKPWLAHRPTLAVFASVQQGAANFVVAADGDRGDLQRDSVLAAAAKYGMSVALPKLAMLDKSRIDAASLARTSPATLAPVAAEQGAEAVLIGRLAWDARALAWTGQWQMDWQNKPHRWQARGATYDDVFRRGVGGVAQLLSGNGEPK